MKRFFKIEMEEVFIDLGAGIGKYSIIIGNMMGNKGKVIAIEPEPKNFKILKKNIELNSLTNVIPINLACSKNEEKHFFYLDNKGVQGHSLIKRTKIKKIIKTKRLDNVLKDLKIKKVDLMKIDVEGAEADVLEGARATLRKNHPKIIFEAWDENYLDKVKKILKAFNYKIKQIAEQNYLAY